MDSKDEQAIRDVELVRKLVLKADSLGDTPEGRTFKAKAEEILTKRGLTLDDVRRPAYLDQVAARPKEDFYVLRDKLAKAMGRRANWRHMDPRDHAYPTKK